MFVTEHVSAHLVIRLAFKALDDDQHGGRKTILKKSEHIGNLYPKIIGSPALKTGRR